MKSYVIPAILFCALLSCSRQTLAPLEPGDEFERAMDLFENRKYNTALQAFERIIFYHASSEYIDDAQFYLGRIYFEKRDYTQAIVEFEYLIKNFSNSPYIEEAYLFRAKAYFYNAPGYEKDQTQTKEAIALFDEFLTRYPNSKFTEEARNLILTARNRLAKKEYESGRIYVKLKEYDSAILYFKYVIENYPETPSANDARYQLALLYEMKGKKDEALSLCRELLDDPKWRAKIEKKIRALEK